MGMEYVVDLVTYLPLRECSTAFSINSVIVCDLNLAYDPNENVPFIE